MAFSFANVASEAAAMGGSSQPGAQMKDGDDLQEIQTSQLGFKTLNGETKIKLLPSPWSSESPPIPSAQLLAVASSQGILAAGGPDTLIIASTNKIRETLTAKEGGSIRDLIPILAIPHDSLTHVAFSSDESVLVVSGPSTSGLVAYQVDRLKAGQNEVALRIHTNGTLRALVPNPNPQAAHLFAVVNNDGELMIADFSTGSFVGGSDGTVLAKGVACVSWSNRGRQLVAGTAAGTALQLKPDGSVVSHIPKSTSIPDETHVSGISWLEDDTFLIIYTPNSTSTDEGIPPSEYYLVERSEKTRFTFHRLPEVLPLFGLERLPTHHFIARLRKFEPHVTDLLLLSATTATDVAIVAKSSAPLSDEAADQTTNTFALAILEDDTKRAALPLSDSSLDTSPIGMVIDLSSMEPVINPLPSDPEIQETAGPVPNMLVLNNEGTLCSWWVIYADSIKQKTTYSGFESLKTVEQIRSAISGGAKPESNQIKSETTGSLAQSPPATTSAFAQPKIAPQPSSFGTPAVQSAFSAPKLQPSQQSAFGTGSGFGGNSRIGETKTSWASTGFGSRASTGFGPTASAPSTDSTFAQSGFGKPAFGTPSAISSSNTPAFGSSTPFGNQSTPFGQASSPASGKTGFGSTTTTSPFAAAGNTDSKSGFASFASSGGFGGTTKDQGSSSPFAKPTSGSGFASFAGPGGFGAGSDKAAENKASPFGFASTPSNQSPFAKATGSNAFGQAPTNGTFGSGQGFRNVSNAPAENKSAFGTATPFKLGSSFKGDGTAKDDLPRPAGNTSFGFGAGFGNLLGESKQEATSAQTREAEMDDSEAAESVSADEKEERFAGFSPAEKKPDETAKLFTTPPSTITQPKTTPAMPVSNLFGQLQNQQNTTPQQPLTGFSFASTTPKETPAASRTLFGTSPVTAPTPALVQKSEPVKSFSAINDAQKSRDAFKFERPTSDPKNVPQISSQDSEKTVQPPPEPPLPPEPASKPSYTTGDTSASSANSKESKEPEDAPLPPDFLSANKPVINQPKEPEDAPLPPDFLPANRSASKEPEAPQLPEEDDDADDDAYSSDFEDSGEDVTEDISAAEGEDEDDEEEVTTDQIQTSPESSFRAGDTTSPTDGLFTKVSTNDTSRSRPLFGEVGASMPMFPPPKPQQSPRSPSPVRPFLTHDALRSDTRSVSAPIQQRSAIDQRKAEYSQSAIAAQAAKAREEESARERARLEAMRRKTQEVKASELHVLEDDEDTRIQKELASPVKPSESLDAFITHQAGRHTESNKADIPTQIERLYQDINSMICTMGINARSLSAFMMFQKGESQYQDWPEVLRSNAPLDALQQQWLLGGIDRLREGSIMLANDIEASQIEGVPQKLQACQSLLAKDLFDLRTKLTAIRKSLHARAHGSVATAPLSAEQASIQHDLRRSSALVQTKLVQLEDTLAVIRARLAEVAPSMESSTQSVQKKPTVEAVTNTIAKMTSMAEKKSADIDVLEAQLKRLDVAFDASINGSGLLNEPSTPRRSRPLRSGETPSSAASSVFYTPDSKAGASAKSTRSNAGNMLSMAMVSAEDRERWQARATRKKNVAAVLKVVLEEKKKKASVGV